MEFLAVYIARERVVVSLFRAGREFTPCPIYSSLFLLGMLLSARLGPRRRSEGTLFMIAGRLSFLF